MSGEQSRAERIGVIFLLAVVAWVMLLAVVVTSVAVLRWIA